MDNGLPGVTSSWKNLQRKLQIAVESQCPNCLEKTVQESEGFSLQAVHFKHLVLLSDYQYKRFELLPGVFMSFQTSKTAIASATGGAGIGTAGRESI